MAHTDKVFPLETTQSTTALALKTTLVTVLRFMWQEENSISQTESAKSSSGKRPASPQVTRGEKKEARAFAKSFSYPNNTTTDFRPVSFMWCKCTVRCTPRLLCWSGKLLSSVHTSRSANLPLHWELKQSWHSPFQKSLEHKWGGVTM